MSVVDLRSDTMTKPTPAMRDAMRDAEVGNASYGEDPTINELERRCGELFGKEAAMFVPSGTMGNQASLKAWTSRKISPEIICHARSHIVLNESAGLATVCGAQVRPLAGPRGVIPLADIERSIMGTWRLNPQTAVIALENTHNYESGAVVPLAHHQQVQELAARHGVPIHLDGARIFNAAAAMGRSVRDIAQTVDSVQFCFSKGLGCPVGSMVVGSQAFMEDALRVRQYLGGGLRQAGVIAAPALVALEEMVPRIGDDHKRCQRLAHGLKGTLLDFQEPETNILVLDTTRTGRLAQDIAQAAAAEGVLFNVIAPHQLRAVTHADVDDAGIARAVDALKAALEADASSNSGKKLTYG